MLRTVASDSLSFPLTAAHACRLAGVRADRSGHLSLLILGAEASELSCVEKWSELLHGSFGLSATTLYLLFVGPRVPKRLDGTFHYYPEGDQSDDDEAHQVAHQVHVKATNQDLIEDESGEAV